MMDKHIFSLVAGITKSHQATAKTVSELNDIEAFSHRGFPDEVRWDWISSDWDGEEKTEAINSYLLIVSITCASVIVIALIVALIICAVMAFSSSSAPQEEGEYKPFHG